jgi:hypothetical protein
MRNGVVGSFRMRMSFHSIRSNTIAPWIVRRFRPTATRIRMR